MWKCASHAQVCPPPPHIFLGMKTTTLWTMLLFWMCSCQLPVWPSWMTAPWSLTSELRWAPRSVSLTDYSSNLLYPTCQVFRCMVNKRWHKPPFLSRVSLESRKKHRFITQDAVKSRQNTVLRPLSERRKKRFSFWSLNATGSWWRNQTPGWRWRQVEVWWAMFTSYVTFTGKPSYGSDLLRVLNLPALF